MAGELHAATEEASQLRKQLAALGAQLDAASSQISQQQAAISALEDTKKQLQVWQGLLMHVAVLVTDGR
jgi:septal ring factor EnvC (AmiA/AmiB activator)